MPFIRLHYINNEGEVLINTDNVIFIGKTNVGSQIYFNVPTRNNNGDQCLWAKVTETIDEIKELIDMENNRI